MDTFETIKNTKGRILGVDFGDTRTGLSLSDPGRILASAIGKISPGGIEKTADAVAQTVKEKEAVAVVVGLPKNMDGSEGFRAERVKQFGKMLEERLDGIPVDFMDERLTTVSASHFLNETNVRGKKRKETIDSLSAEIILQDYLEKLKH